MAFLFLARNCIYFWRTFNNAKMKSILPFLAIMLLFSCGSARNAAMPTDPTEERIVGTVHIEKDCGTLINAKIGKTRVTIFPNNLDEKYHVEGMKIKFFFKNSSIPVPANCPAQARGNVEEVTPLR